MHVFFVIASISEAIQEAFSVHENCGSPRRCVSRDDETLKFLACDEVMGSRVKPEGDTFLVFRASQEIQENFIFCWAFSIVVI